MRPWHALVAAGAAVATASFAAYVVLNRAPRLPFTLTLQPLVQPSEIQSPSLDLEAAVLPLPTLLDLAEAARLVQSSHGWTRSDPLLSKIVVDFGRSHYFVVDTAVLPGSDDAELDIVRTVHKHCFDGGASAEERKRFFTSIGVDPDFALQACSQVSPTRNAVVCRAKYELLVRYLVRCGRTEERAHQEALLCLAVATQGPLHYLKARVSERVLAHTTLRVSWAYFQLKYCARPDGVVLIFALSSVLPAKEGLWQAHRQLSPPTEPLARATCTLFLSTSATMENVDLGSAQIEVQAPSAPLLTSAVKQPWGVYDSDNAQIIPFRDTSPTW